MKNNLIYILLLFSFAVYATGYTKQPADSTGVSGVTDSSGLTWSININYGDGHKSLWDSLYYIYFPHDTIIFSRDGITMDTLLIEREK